MRLATCVCIALLCLLPAIVSAQAPVSPFATPLTAADLDAAAYTQWVDGVESPVAQGDGPRHVVWTRDSQPTWDGVKFGAGANPGTRYLRIGFTNAVAVGSVLVCGGGQLSVLKPTAAYPGNVADDTQWIPASRIVARQVCNAPADEDQFALWVLPPNTLTRAVRFTHTADITEKTYNGFLRGVYLLRDRYVNIAPQAEVIAYKNPQHAGSLTDERLNGFWGAWDNWDDATAQPITPAQPGWILLTWPRPVTLRGLNALFAGFGSADVQAYTGPATRHPREAAETDWQTIDTYTKLENQYPRALGVNWLAFPQPVTTRAIRLRMTSVARESHPHLNGRTVGGKRLWLSELVALQPLDAADLATAILPAPASADLGHPPIPVRFTLKTAGDVTLVIEDKDHQRVRNLVSETWFPAGDNVVWWDGQDDLGRDVGAAGHGLYNVPGHFVAPGAYRVRGLTHQPFDLRYEFPIYTGGSPAWNTADGTGAWLANHTPPSGALFVPAACTPNGQPMVYLGSAVSEGTHGLAWVDLDGKKLGGTNWVGGIWTGAPFLAFDAGAKADAGTSLYAGSIYQDDLRLTAILHTPNGAYKEQAVTKYTFAKKAQAAISGLAAHDGLLIAALPALKQLLGVDVRTGAQVGAIPLDDPRGLAFDAQGRLLALAGAKLLRYTLPADLHAPVTPETLIAQGLDDPRQLTLDRAGNLYISDGGASHQVKVFTPDGKFLRAIGHPGVPAAGPYDPLHLNNPNGLSIDSRDHLWVTETDYQPKRVSVWTLDGTLVTAFYGPSEYGGGGRLDPQDRTLFYYGGMVFKLDWAKGTNQLQSVFLRPGPDSLPLPFRNALPDQPIYANGQKYLTNCYNSNPTSGAGAAMIWIMRNGLAVPVAAMGRANDWDILKTDAFKPLWPAGIDLNGDMWKNQAAFLWTDLNGDGQVQPDEVTMVKGGSGGITVMPDLALVDSRLDGNTVRFAPARFTARGVPVYDLAAGQPLATEVHGPTSSGGDQALVHPNGWTVLSVAPKPYAAHSLCGVLHGEPRWSYPDMWPGLHASHEAAVPDTPGEIIGTTRLLGGFIEAPNQQVGPLWAINGNMGNMYLFTADGLFVATLFRDVRQGKSWSMPKSARNMLLNELTCHDENFWPSITQTADGKVYLVDGGRSSLVRVDGLDSVQRLPDAALTVTPDDLREAQAYFVQREALRQHAQGTDTLAVSIRATAPTVDGKLDDWAGVQWATIDKRGVKANFNSHSQPYDVSGAVLVAGDRLYAAFRTADADLLRNAGTMATAPFKTGGALDLMIGTDPAANPARPNPVAGDLRLLVTQVKGKTLALLYRGVVPGTKDPVPFSSPWRTITLDQVDDVSNQVQLAGADGNYELSIPLATLHLTPQPGMKIKADLGVLRGDGFQTTQRVYWNNKATGITADVPSEAQLTPVLWGYWQFTAE